MTDEASAMLRVAAFAFVVSFIYSFTSYEFVGTWGLIALCLGPGFAGLIMYFEARKHLGANESLRDAIWRFAGLPRMDPAERHELAATDLAVLPAPCLWPLIMTVGFAVTLTGLIFGLWLVLIGVIFVVWGVWGWMRAVGRETRAANALGDNPAQVPVAR
jgi:hypothetical protein